MKETEKLKNTVGDFAKDIRLNLDTIISPEGTPGLTQDQRLGIILSCAYHSERREMILAIQSDLIAMVSKDLVEAAKAAATIMAMNNVYYRSIHLSEDSDLSVLPAKLRMNVIGKPGIPKIDFELMCLAVSAIEGCGKCIQAHVNEARKAQISTDGIHSALRISSVINGLSKALSIEEMSQTSYADLS